MVCDQQKLFLGIYFFIYKQLWTHDNTWLLNPRPFKVILMQETLINIVNLGVPILQSQRYFAIPVLNWFIQVFYDTNYSHNQITHFNNVCILLLK